MATKSIAQSPRESRSKFRQNGNATKNIYDGNKKTIIANSRLASPFVRKRYRTVPRIGSSTPNHKDVLKSKMIKMTPQAILSKASSLVQEAILNKKIFMIFGPYDKIRKVLRKRGWVEKLHDQNSMNSTFLKCLKQYKNHCSNKLPMKLDGDVISLNSFGSDDLVNDDIEDIKSEYSGDEIETLDDGAVYSDSNVDVNDDEIDEEVYGNYDEMDEEVYGNYDERDDYDEDLDNDCENGVCDIIDEHESDLLHAVASCHVDRCNPDLIWTLRLTQFNSFLLKPNQIINHHRKAAAFTTKTGLIKSFSNLRWFQRDPDEIHPRTFIISEEPERKSFIDDFHLTACVGLIKIAAWMSSSSNESSKPVPLKLAIPENNRSKCVKVLPAINYSNRKIGDSPNKIEKKYLEMAVHYCQLHLKSIKTLNVDMQDFHMCSQKRWEIFFKNYELVTEQNYGIELTDNLKTSCQRLVREMSKINYQFEMDGYKNIWIVKPGAKSRGRGIHCISRFSEMMHIINNIYERLIIQKYIEKPFLVYNTKFDIRQWFMVTSWSPLTIWWYKDCYIRFCSQQFTLNDLNESVHLSNNSIQHKYANGPRSKQLPSNNMWHWQQFDNYLKKNGHGDAWESRIVPVMKSTIIDILLCTQDFVEDRKNSFELYGADFMISQPDLKTWILEINSSPCMAASTDVTAELTQNLSEDIIKVVLDYPNDKLCDTGRFQLVYKQHPFTMPVCSKTSNLIIRGNGIKKPIPKNTSQADVLPECSDVHQKKSFSPESKNCLRQKLQGVIANPNKHSEAGFSLIGPHSEKKGHERNPMSVSHVKSNIRYKQKLMLIERFSEVNKKDRFVTRVNNRSLTTNSKPPIKNNAQRRNLSPLSEKSIFSPRPSYTVIGKENSLPAIPTNKPNRNLKSKMDTVISPCANNAEAETFVNKKMTYNEAITTEISAPKKPITIVHAYKSLIKKSLEQNLSLLNKMNSSNKLENSSRRMNEIMAAYMPKHCLT